MKQHGLSILQIRKKKGEDFGLENVLETFLEATWFIYFTAEKEEKKRENFGLVF